MPTLQFNGQTVSFNHPRELRAFGHPTPPWQPVASWPATCAQFEALCNGEQFESAIAHLHAEHCSASLTDVPEAKRAAFKAWNQKHLRATPAVLVGPSGDWFTDGIPRQSGGV